MSRPKCLHTTWIWIVVDTGPDLELYTLRTALRMTSAEPLLYSWIGWNPNEEYASIEDAKKALMDEIENECYVPIAASWDINAPQPTAHSMPSHEDRRPT